MSVGKTHPICRILPQVNTMDDLVKQLRHAECDEDCKHPCPIMAKVLRQAADRIETLLADIDEYQQQQDEIIVALGSKGILPSEIVSKVRTQSAEVRGAFEAGFWVGYDEDVAALPKDYMDNAFSKWKATVSTRQEKDFD